VAELEAVSLLRQAPFLRQVEDAALQTAAEALQRQEHPAGSDILAQGAPVDALHFVARGSVEIIHRERSGQTMRLTSLGPGDAFGEAELVFRLPRLAAVRCSEPTTLYRWDRRALAAFLKEHPAALAGLRFSAACRRLALRMRFSWIATDEALYAVARKHEALLYQALSLPALILIGAVALGIWAASASSALLGWLAVVLGVAALAYGAWQALDWGNDYYLITDRRVVWVEKVVGLYESRREAPLHMVLSVTTRTDAVSRSLGYGDVIVRTYTGQIIFRNVGNPLAMAAMIEEHWRRLQARQQQADRDALARSLHERMGSTPEAAPPAPPPPAPERPASNTGLDHWTFQVRFEDQGVITYRKHWAVLLRTIGVPSVLVVLTAGLAGARLAGWITLLPLGMSLLIAAIAFMALLGWWTYRYIDWANDIYQITPTQILDIHRKPLGEERREVAPLENILGTEVDRKGLLGLLLNFGNVTANIGTAQFVFEGVYDPVGVQQDITRAQGAFMQRKRDTEVGQRRQEMVELLNLYHEEIATAKPPEGGEPQA
jgi:hypothetical protein